MDKCFVFMLCVVSFLIVPAPPSLWLMESSYASQILMVALCSFWDLVLLCVHNNFYCFLSKWRIHFFCHWLYGNYNLTVMILSGSGINWTRDQEQTERTKSTTHIYLSHSPRIGHVCAVGPLQKITCMREWPCHFATRHCMWHRSKWTLITRTNKTLSLHLYSPNNFYILNWVPFL